MKTIEQKAKKVPAIRFAGFEDEWVEKKLGDVAVSFGYGLNAAAKPYDGTNKYLRITDIDDSSRDFKKDDLTTPDFDLVKANDYRLDEGDLLFARTGASVGKTFIYKKSDGLVYFAGFLIRAKIKSEYDSKFIFQNTLTNPYDKFVKITSQRSGQPGINAQEYADYSLLMPKLNEQQKIGSFFSNIDSLISLEQKKYDKLMQVKKSMLEKMFPKEGATVPEIRFAGFSGDWKEKKLSDEFVDFIVPMRDKPKSFDGKIPWTRIEDIEGKFLNGSLSGQYVSEKTIAQMNLKVIPKNSLIVSSSATFGVVAVVTQDLVTNQTFIGLVPNDKESLDFWYIFFYSDKAREYMKSQSAGSTIFYIARESFENMPVMIPSREEQQKIGSYFSHLDSLISLQQRKLEKLKNIKKSLLEKMFV
ncbi:restriction endonuclease subunit S [uncultured Fibrobacter sp.]|uniref:restriction endonuclease subunit S n=1 Tax=uncultured Fibrobacter sp. TaxID=261512 RepID=UPI0025FBDC92|nr:restriction endonuclease subunit S [uncultured Fibrobacter sp.]